MSPVIVGLPWLKIHNPLVDWSTASIVNWSVFCHANCLRSAIPTSVSPLRAPRRRLIYQLSPVSIMTSSRYSVRTRHSHYLHIDLMIVLLIYFLVRPPLLKSYITSPNQRKKSWRHTSRTPSQPASSAPHPLGAGSFLVEKRDRSLHPCIDYTGLNEIAIKNKYPLQLMDSAFTPLHDSVFFTKLDLRNAYHFVRIREGDKWKTADASDSAVGAIFFQRSSVNHKLHPCAFFSRRLSPAERNYDVGNRELLAVQGLTLIFFPSSTVLPC